MCYQCQRRNKQVVKYATLQSDVATFPMQFISMDLIGEFHPPTSRRHRYALTVICMLTGYVFCIPLKTKTGEEVIQAYIDNIYCCVVPVPDIEIFSTLFVYVLGT